MQKGDLNGPKIYETIEVRLALRNCSKIFAKSVNNLLNLQQEVHEYHVIQKSFNFETFTFLCKSQK